MVSHGLQTYGCRDYSGRYESAPGGKSGAIKLPIDERRVVGELELPDHNENAAFNDSHDVLNWRRMQQAFVREPTLPGLVDREIRVLSFDDVETERARIYVVGWGAAPAMNETGHVLSADYPGRVRTLLEERNPGTVAVWLTTAASDTMVADRHVFIPKSSDSGELAR